MEIITSVSNQLIKDINLLKQKKRRLEKQEFILEGKHLVEEAYKNNVLLVVLSTDKTYLENYKNVRTVQVSDTIIEKLSSTKTPQSVIGVAKMQENKLIKSDRYVVLDGVNDPGNLGTIIRTSLAFGINNLILSNNTVDVYNEKVIRATQGAIFKANIYYTDLENIYKTFKEEEIKIIVTSLEAKQTLNNLAKPNKFAVVVGNEANGISDVSKQYADELVIIPIQNNIESLNVAIATSIVLYSLTN
ncbi:MAG: RNA methyltransferase [Bacilli bacterium]|nr:RNA methyltransferase [Bacilli bacterium]